MPSEDFFLKDYIEERAVEIAYYIIETKATVRQTAKKFGISKSTVHKDVTDRLSEINPGLAGEARKILDVNKEERTSVADLLPGRSTFICSIEPADVPLASPRYAIQKEAAGSQLLQYV